MEGAGGVSFGFFFVIYCAVRRAGGASVGWRLVAVGVLMAARGSFGEALAMLPGALWQAADRMGGGSLSDPGRSKMPKALP